MAIRVEHGSVMPALSLARIAGKGQATQQQRAADLALLDFGLRMEAQRDRREAQERAFSLQLAAARRRDRTPMARAQIKSPFAIDPVQKRVEDERAYQVARQDEQLERIKQMVARGDMSPQEAARNELRVRGGQSLKFGEEEISISERLFDPRRRIKQLQKEWEMFNAYALSPDTPEKERQVYASRATSIKEQMDVIGAGVSTRGQTIDPKTGATAAVPAATGPQATTKRLAGKPSPARKRQAVAAAKLMLIGAEPKDRTREKITELAETLLLNPMLLNSLRTPQ